MFDQKLVKSLAVVPGPGGRYLERLDSKEPVFIQADTAWELCHRLTREEAILYIQTRASQGFNVIFTVLLPELDARSATGEVLGPDGSKGTTTESAGGGIFYPNRYGEVPLINDDPNTPNEKYFAHVDWVVQTAAENGILIFIVPSWSRFLNGGWHGGSGLFDDNSAFSYGAYMGKRYPFLPKILGGDTNPLWTHGDQIWRRLRANGRKPDDLPLPTVDGLPRTDMTSLINSMAAGIISTEAAAWGSSGKPLLTYHPTALWMPWGPEATASNFFGNEDWLTLDGCQSGHADFPNVPFEPSFGFWDTRASHVPLGKMWEASTGRGAQGKPVRPVFDLESHYEELHNALNAACQPIWGADDVRAGAWQQVLSGACGTVYGANCTWQMYDEDRSKVDPNHKAVCGLDSSASWRRTMLLPGPSQLKIIHNFLLSLPPTLFHSRVPAQELLVSSEAPDEWKERDARVDVMRLSDSKGGGVVIAHSGYGYAFSLNVEEWAGRKIKAEWLDPRTGDKTSIAVIESSKAHFEPPTKGSVKEDWVLILTII